MKLKVIERRITMNQYYPHLFQPLRLNSIMLKNRIFSSSMGVPWSHQQLSTTYYGNTSLFDKSRGGAAIVHAACESVPDESGEYPKHDRDRLRESISVARQYGAKVCVGVGPLKLKGSNSTGSMRSHYDGGVNPAPSPFTTRTGNVCHELSIEEIQEMVHGAAVSAKCAKDFGFDLIQIGLGYEGLLAQFLSPYYNRRTDKYGGSLENRLRFTIETVQAVREAVGKDYPIILMVGASHHLKGSYSFEDILEAVSYLQDYVDLIHVSAGMDMVPGQWEDDPIIDPSLGLEGWYKVNGKHCQSIFEPNLTNLHWAKEVKKKYPDMLVSVVGSIMTPDQAEKIIAEGFVDAVVMARPLTADPFLPRKAMSGHQDDIVPCIRCLYCYHTATIHANTQCSVNPRYRRENRVPEKIEKADISKKVVVVGGGPAGMKAAITAAQRGHEVILLEKEDHLGGQLNYAKYENRKLDTQRYLNYLIHQVGKHPIDVRLNTRADEEYLKGLHADAILVCIGAELIQPKIAGSEHALTCLDALKNQQKVGKKVVIVGGGQIGIELGIELSDHERDVTVIEKTDKIASNGNLLYHIGLVEYLKTKEDVLHTMVQTECLEITPTGVKIKKDDIESFIEADTIITAVGMKSKKEEAFAMYGIADETFTIGDCDHVGKILDAINDAFFIAYNL